MKPRPCMSCGNLLDMNGDCATKDCPYNPRADMVEHDADLKEGTEIEHTGGEFGGDDDLGELDQDELDALLNDDDEPFDPESLADTDDLNGLDDSPKHTEDDEVAEDSDKMDLSQEDLPDPQGEKKQSERESKDKNDREAEDDVTDLEVDDAPEPDDLSDKRYDESDQDYDQEREGQGEDDPDLPPRPRGCNGDCKPTDDPSEGDEPCPHCTAKQFKEQMEQEGKENLPEEEMQQEMDNFLDEWNQQAEKDGNGGQQEGEDGETPDYDQGIEDEIERHEDQGKDQSEGLTEDEQKLADELEQQGQDDDPDLPPRPQGCSGDCQPGDDPDGETCPHCTAKQFKLGLEENGQDPDDLDPEEFEKMLDDFRKNWEKEGEQKKEEQKKEEKAPEQNDEDPPEDEMQDVPEKEPDGDEEEREFKRMGKNLTVTQEKRFDNLSDRLKKKVESTFGQTAEDIYQMPKTDGQFEGEELSQTIQITSRGVTYWVTIAAAKQV